MIQELFTVKEYKEQNGYESTRELARDWGASNTRLSALEREGRRFWIEDGFVYWEGARWMI